MPKNSLSGFSPDYLQRASILAIHLCSKVISCLYVDGLGWNENSGTHFCEKRTSVKFYVYKVTAKIGTSKCAKTVMDVYFIFHSSLVIFMPKCYHTCVLFHQRREWGDLEFPFINFVSNCWYQFDQILSKKASSNLKGPYFRCPTFRPNRGL